jgi:o-succinylbenzoate---CoA ligase
MNRAIDYLTAPSQDEWLVGYANQDFYDQAWSRYQALIALALPPTILLAEREPIAFLASFIAACAANCPIALANPDWAEAEWQQVMALIQPDLIWGEPNACHDRASLPPSTPPPIDPSTRKPDQAPQKHPAPCTLHPLSLPAAILIPTSGSTGKLRFAVHTWDTLMAAVQGFRDYFEVDRVNSYCVLPLHHVSGLMQFLRSFTSGGQLVILPFKAFAAGQLPSIAPADFFLSLVPTQLHRLITPPLHPKALPDIPETPFTLHPCSSPHPAIHSSTLLPHFQAIFLGGAPAWADLLAQARALRLPIAPTYGMTETAAQIVTLKPAAWLAGQTGCGQVLPHAQVQIISPLGAVLPPNHIGQITIQADSLMLGYYPSAIGSTPDLPHSFSPDDLGYLDPSGCLHIVGRNSQKIITGGENVYPAEVEAAIRATQLVIDVCVIGQPDSQWGQVVTALYVPQGDVTETTLRQAVAPHLSKFKQPKRWLQVTALPRNAQGKINFAQLEQIMQRNQR